jgi:hypothetical protein
MWAMFISVDSGRPPEAGLLLGLPASANEDVLLAEQRPLFGGAVGGAIRFMTKKVMISASPNFG